MPRGNFSVKPEGHGENTLEGIQAIADYLGKSYSTVHKWIKYHSLPAMISPGGEWFTTKDAINSWIIATGSEDVRLMQANPFDFPPSVGARFQKSSATMHERVDAEKRSALEFLYMGKVNTATFAPKAPISFRRHLLDKRVA